MIKRLLYINVETTDDISNSKLRKMFDERMNTGDGVWLDPEIEVAFIKHVEEQVTPEEPCDHEWEIVDDSFDHEYGREQIVYEKCSNCGETRGHDDLEDTPYA